MSISKLRHQDHYIAVTRELREAGYGWGEEFGGKHARLLIDVGGREETVIMSITPSDHRAASNAVGDIRRRIRSWKAEAADAAAPDLFQTLEVAGKMDDSSHHGETRVVRFRDAEILTLERDGVPYAAVRPIVEGMGLDWNAQYQRIKRDPVLSEGMCVIHMPTNGGTQEVVALPLKMINGFLFGVDSKRVRSALRDTVVAYQRECFDVLAQHWMGGAVAPYQDDTEAMLSIVSEAMRTFQSGITTLIEHVDGAKAANLHYMKAYIRGPAESFHEDVRHRNVAAYKRDHQVITVLGELNRRIGNLIAIAGPMISERPFLWSEWYDAARIYAEHFPGRVIPKKGFLSTAIAKGLDSRCKQSRHFHHMEQRVVGGHPRNFWHKDAVWEWLDAGGRDLVEAHIQRHTPSAQVISMVEHQSLAG